MYVKEFINRDELMKAYDIYKHCMYLPTIEKYEKRIALFLRDKSVKIYACLSEEGIKGIIVISLLECDKAEILGIAVDTYFRRQGVGSCMVRMIKNAHALRFIYAETDEDAVMFYVKNGFKVTKIVKDYDGQEIVRYQCELVVR